MRELQQLGHDMLSRALADDRQEFGSFFLSRLLGFDIAYDATSCSVLFEATKALCNPQGSLHGGILALAMDTSMGHLLHHVAGTSATLEMKVQYLIPVNGGLIRCKATFLRQGRKLSFLESCAHQSDGILVAHATATWKARTPRP